MTSALPSLSAAPSPAFAGGFFMRTGALALVLGVALSAFWLLGTRPWSPPPAQAPDASLFDPLWPPASPRAASEFDVQAERPLFNPSRRPEKDLGPVAAPAADTFDQWTLLGVFGTTRTQGGVIVRAPDQQVHRITVGQVFEGWTLQTVEPKAAVFTSAEGQRRVALQRLPQQGQLLATPAPMAKMPIPAPPAAPPPEISPENPPKNSFLEAIQRAMEAAQQQQALQPPTQ